MSKFYENIEFGIRGTVKLLRDNGFNTTCSCEHEMYIQFDFIDSSQIDVLYNLLFNAEHRGFRIEASIQSPSDGFPVRRGTVYFNEWRC